MQKFNNILKGLTLILVLTSFSLAAWETQDVGFPEDIQVSAVSVVNDNIAWVVGGHILSNPPFQGISHTIDGGETWIYDTIAVPGFNLSDYITVDVFALSSHLAWVVMAYDEALPHKGLIVKTGDGGANWEAQTSAFPIEPGLHNGPDFVHFFDVNNGVTAGDLEEIYTTSDGGANWTRVPTSNYPPILDNEDPYNGSYCTMGDSSLAFGTNAGRVFRTWDRGATWTASDVGLGNSLIWTTFQDEMVGLATAPIVGTEIAKTTDGGVTWITLANTLPTKAILSHQKGTESTYMYGSAGLPLFVGSEPGTGFTSDFGSTWYDQQDTLSLVPTIWSDSTTGWSAGLDNMIHIWNVDEEIDQDPNWVAQDPGYPTDMNVLNHNVVDENIVWTIGGRGTDQAIYHGFSKTLDGGETWEFGTISNPDLNNYFLTNIFALDANTAWITMADNTSNPIQGRIYKTSDGGSTWVHQSTAYPNSQSIAGSSNFVHFFDANNGITIGDFGKTYITDNGGDQWTLVSSNLIPTLLSGEEPMMSNFSVAGDQSLFYGTNKGRIFYTHDAGASWDVSAPGFGQLPIFASFQNEMIGVAVSPFTTTEIAKTEDGGDTWTMLPTVLPYPGLLSHVKGTEQTYVHAAAALPLYIPNSPYGYGITDDFGETFEYSGDLHLGVSYFANPSVGWAGADDNKIYKWGSTVATDDIVYSTPNEYTLSQNFPNPFNPNTTIRFEMDIPGHVNLEVFDIRGARVATLANDQLASGLHEVTFDASRLASGTYIYRLSISGGTQSRKMLLIK